MCFFDVSSVVFCISLWDLIGDISGSYVVVVVGFDVNVKEGSVVVIIWWVLSNVIIKGGMFVLVGVMGMVWGLLGYKV